MPSSVQDLRRAARPVALKLFRRGQRPSLFVVLFAGLVCLIAPAGAQELHLPREILPAAKLTSVTADGWAFTVDGKSVIAPDVVRWGAWPGIVKNQAIWLSDGSWLAGEFHIERGASLSIDNDWLSIPPVEFSMVRGMVVNPPASISKWIDLQRQMLAADGGQDIIWLNDHRLSGVIRWDAAAEDSQSFYLDAGGQTTQVELQHIQAIVFSPALVGPVPATAPLNIGLVDGSLLNVEQRPTVGRTVEVELPCGLTLTSLDDPQEYAGAITYLAGHPDGVDFLSELRPVSFRNVSDTRLVWELGVDRDVYGKPLQVQRAIVPHGLALHSSSQVAYRPAASSRRFLAQAVLADVDPHAAVSLGSAACKVLLARDGKLETALEFNLARRQSAGEPTLSEKLVDIDIRGAQLVVLIVEKDDYGQFGDQVLWLDARIAQ